MGTLGRVNLGRRAATAGKPYDMWHQEGVTFWPLALSAFDDVPRLLRDHILPGHLPADPLLDGNAPVITFGSCFAYEIHWALELGGMATAHISVGDGLNNTFALRDFMSWCVTGSATPRGHGYQRDMGGTIVDWTPEHERTIYRSAFADAGAVVITVGLAEVWSDKISDLVYWRGIPARDFDARRHVLRVSTVEENSENLSEVVELIRLVNKEAAIIFSLSPVPLNATFRRQSCLTADCVSKSILRVAIDNVMAAGHKNVFYWPTFELVRWAGSALDWRAFARNSRHVDRYLIRCATVEFVHAFYGHDIGVEFGRKISLLSRLGLRPHFVRGHTGRVKRYLRYQLLSGSPARHQVRDLLRRFVGVILGQNSRNVLGRE